MIRRPPRSTLFPCTTLCRSALDASQLALLTRGGVAELVQLFPALGAELDRAPAAPRGDPAEQKARLLWNFSQLDRKSTRLNSSPANISYAVFCLKTKNRQAA